MFVFLYRVCCILQSQPLRSAQQEQKAVEEGSHCSDWGCQGCTPDAPWRLLSTCTGTLPSDAGLFFCHTCTGLLRENDAMCLLLIYPSCVRVVLRRVPLRQLQATMTRITSGLLAIGMQLCVCIRHALLCCCFCSYAAVNAPTCSKCRTVSPCVDDHVSALAT